MSEKNPSVSPTCVKVRADEKAAVGMLDLRRQEEFSVMRPSQLKQEGSILHNIKMREKKSGKVRFIFNIILHIIKDKAKYSNVTLFLRN